MFWTPKACVETDGKENIYKFNTHPTTPNLFS